MKLIYVMDPHCGWCYGNSKNMTEIYKTYQNNFDFEILAGGMWIGKDAPNGGEWLYGFLKDHAPRMEQTTGMPVSEAYYSLGKDSTYTFSSLEPSAAIFWVKKNDPQKSFQFAKAVQKVLFAQGKKMDQPESYLPILDELEIPHSEFKKQWLSEEIIDGVNKEFLKAQEFAQGFPTLVLQTDSNIQTITSGYFELDPMKKVLDSLLKE
jgi:putative protein-disulfide isomerase